MAGPTDNRSPLPPVALLSLLLVAPALANPSPSSAALHNDLVSRAWEAHGAPEHLVAGAALVRLQADVPSPQRKSTLSAAAREALLKDIGERTGVALTFVRPSVLGFGLYAIADAADAAQAPRYVPTEAETRALIDRVRTDEAVADAAINGWRRPYVLPNDERVDDMWALEAIDAAGAWNITTGTAGQRVGVVDTGIIRAHEDLSAADVTGYDFVSDTFAGNDGDGRDAQYNDPGDGADCGQGFRADSWHGTHTSGTMVATTNNGVGTAGLNWAAGLVTVRGLGRCGGTDDDIMSGVAWLAGYDWQQDNTNPLPIAPLPSADVAQVINMSLGGPGACSGFQQSVIDYANTNGTLVVVASGNEGGPVASPANCAGAIAVGAHGPDLDRADFSNFGPETVVYAPGGQGNNPSAWVLSTYGPNTDAYTRLPGTSMASPHVAGAVSLMLDLDPTLDRDQVAALLDQGATCTGCDAPRLSLYDTLAAVTPGEDPPAELEDALEENDTAATAAALPCGATLTLEANDDDYFRIDLAAGASFDALLTPTGQGDIDLALVDGAGLALAATSQNADALPETMSFTSDGQRVFLHAYPWFNPNTGDDNHGPYTLSLACTEAPAAPEPDPTPDVTPEPDPGAPDPRVDPEPAAEPDPGLPPGTVAAANDDVAHALPVRCGDELRLILEEDDWFAIPVDDFTTLSVSTRGEAAVAPVEITTTGGDVVLATSSGAAMEQTVARSSLGAGTYAVHAKADAGATGYTIAFACEEQVPDAGGCSHVSGARGAPAWGALALLLLPALSRRRRRR